MSTSTNVHQVINPNYQSLGRQSYGNADHTGGVVSQKLTKRAKLNGSKGDTAQNAISDILGDAIITPVMSRNLDLQQGYPHATTGIPYAIQGSATLINVDVSEYLASFQDPIKAILGTSIHREAKVIVSRKYVVGGRALITPEHAPARTVSIQEDSRETIMTRYGGDIEMNLNLFLRPGDAKEELALKVGAQRRELERTLVEHGYAVLMEEGTNLTDAILRSNPAYSTATNAARERIVQAAERINISSVFGALSKHSYPIQNLLAAAKYASAYTTTNDKGTVLLLPHGSPDILRNTRRENMVYNISGPALLARNQGKPIEMTYDDAYTDPSTNVRILIHRPFPTFEGGVANPDVGMGGLTDIATFANFYRMEKAVDGNWFTHAVNWHDRCWNRFKTPPLTIASWEVFQKLESLSGSKTLTAVVELIAEAVNTGLGLTSATDEEEMVKRLGKFVNSTVVKYSTLATALIKDAFTRFRVEFDVVLRASDKNDKYKILNGFYDSEQYKYVQEYEGQGNGSDADIKNLFDASDPGVLAFNAYKADNWGANATGSHALCEDVNFRKSAASVAYFKTINLSEWQKELIEIMTDVLDKIVPAACKKIQSSMLDAYATATGDVDGNLAYIKIASRSLYMVLTNSMKSLIRVEILKDGLQALSPKWGVGGSVFIGTAVGEGTATDAIERYGGVSNENTLGTEKLEENSVKIEKLTVATGFSAAQNDAMEPLMLRLRCDAVMSSAILAAPGSDTGELLIGYPFTSISKCFAANQSRACDVRMCSTHQRHLFLTWRVCTHTGTSSTEIVKIQLRVYLGAVSLCFWFSDCIFP